MKTQWIWVLLILWLSVGCDEDEDTDYQSLLLSESWTQKTGLVDGIFYGHLKMFHEATFRADGTCTLKLDNLGVPSTVETIETVYMIEGDQLHFPEPIGTYIVEEQSMDAFISDWEILSFQSDLLHLKSLDNSTKEGWVISSAEIYLEVL